MQEQVQNEQGGKRQARIIVHGDPLGPDDAQVTCRLSAAFREKDIKYQTRDKRRDEGDQAADIDYRVLGNAFHKPILAEGALMVIP